MVGHAAGFGLVVLVDSRCDAPRHSAVTSSRVRDGATHQLSMGLETLEPMERDLIGRGHSAAEARDAARRAVGNETLMREDARAVWLWPSLDAICTSGGELGSLARA
ncbi:MAG: hypothetical protein K0S86_4346 [Geminicoccaceae bacterium]|nr:hypothetical protein [Geminicoccaceae bacterium]